MELLRMRSPRHPAGLRALAPVLLLLLAAPAARAASEEQVIAAFLFNFAKFVEWPAERFESPDAPIEIGVISDGGFRDTLASVVEGKTVQGRPIQVASLEDAGAARGRHIVFAPASASSAAGALSTSLSGQPVLTVADEAGFAEDGGIVGFLRQDGKIRFEINEAAASRAGLRISSRLLQLAVKVY